MNRESDIPRDPTPGEQHAVPRRHVGIPTLAIGLGIALVLGGGGYWAVHAWRARAKPAEARPIPLPDDPRLTYVGPFQNVHPDVVFVGDAKCAKCHRDKAASYHEHPMGRSLVPVSRVEPQASYGKEANNPFDGLGTQFRLELHGDSLSYHQIARDENRATIYDADTPVDFAIGSGTRGYSFLTNREGYLFQAPVSWFSQKQIWDVSPGYTLAFRAGRPVTAECLFCHANRARPVEGTVNRYEQPIFDGFTIGCERCHGPGGKHVEDPGRMDPSTGADYTIVNPKHLSPELRASVCEQCHVTGEARVVPRGRGFQDYRPGLPFEAFRAILLLDVEKSGGQKAVSHFEQMYQSRCFHESAERSRQGTHSLGCTSCHDPHEHVGPEERIDYYRRRCLECHAVGGCSLPEPARRQRSPSDSCIDCHMPRFLSEDVPHNASTNHAIPRRAMDAATANPTRGDENLAFTLLHAERLDTGDPENQRNLGIGLSHALARFAAVRAPLPRQLRRQALDKLDLAVRNDPSDLEALEAKAEVLALSNRPDEALTLYETVLVQAPSREITLVGAAYAAQAAQQGERALTYLRRAAAANPWQASHHANLAKHLVQLGRWPEALEPTQAWVRLDPAEIEARVQLVICLAKSGQKPKAREEFARIERLRPSNLPRLQAHFGVELRDP